MLSIFSCAFWPSECLWRNVYLGILPIFHFFFFLELHSWHMEVPRLGVELEPKLPAYVTATALQDPSHVCNLCCSSRQHWILSALSEAGDRAQILMDTSWVLDTDPKWELPLKKCYGSTCDIWKFQHFSHFYS